jgi:hypothetical protein
VRNESFVSLVSFTSFVIKAAAPHAQAAAVDPDLSLPRTIVRRNFRQSVIVRSAISQRK